MNDYELFKTLIYKKSGIDLSAYKEKQMKRRIEALATRRGFNKLADYYRGLDREHRLYDEFLNYITINVSEFFRNPSQWDVLRKEVIPFLLGSKKSIKVWSCACSTGEEPYSLVMAFSEFLRLDEIRVLATDIDEGAIAKARIGVYRENSLKNLPPGLKAKFFSRSGSDYRIADAVKERVDFRRLNLLEDNFPAQCDLIVCRNVLIYFTEDAKQQLYRKFGSALSEDGVLFVGSTEQIILPQKYNFTPMRVFFYKKGKN
jgi:chemotaxis protein methyltransferase CheR